MPKNHVHSKINFPFSNQLKLLGKALNTEDELRLVGGCVRDFILKKTISDIDLACKYQPGKIIEILNQNNIKVLPTGLKHGTVTAVIDKTNFEITTLREDVKTDGRHAQVEFIDDFLSDAKRRDFTINAMSIDFENNLYDYFGGMDDLKNQTVKFIGDPSTRIKEDYLRILRFFRFSCYYAKSLDAEGLKASIQFKNEIKNLSADRVRSEFVKIISCSDDNKLIKILSTMQENGLLELILISGNFDLKYFDNLINLEKKLSLKIDHRLRFAALIYSQKKSFLEIAKKLNFSNKEIKFMNDLINPEFAWNLNMEESALLGLLFDYDEETIVGRFIIYLVSLDTKKDDDLIKKILRIKELLKTKKPPKFPVDGYDLLALNIPSRGRGSALKLGRDYWIKNNFNPSKEMIIKFIRNASF